MTNSKSEERKAKRRAWLKEYLCTPEYKAKAKAYYSTPESKAKVKAYRSTPEYKAKVKAYHNTPEYKAKARAAYLKRKSKEQLAKIETLNTEEDLVHE